MSRRDRYGKNTREPGAFIALPCSVLDSAAYQALSHTARSLLLEVARQYHSDDNGRMLLTGNYLAPRGWRSPEVITRAKRELIDAGLIFETVKGGRPNKASWYAVTWHSLDPHRAYDAGAQRAFVRGAYRVYGAPATAAVVGKRSVENASLTTSAVVADPSIATSAVVEKGRATTSGVAIRPTLGESPTTSDVDPLDKPFPQYAGTPDTNSDLPRWYDDGGPR